MEGEHRALAQRTCKGEVTSERLSVFMLLHSISLIPPSVGLFPCPGRGQVGKTDRWGQQKMIGSHSSAQHHEGSASHGAGTDVNLGHRSSA